MRSLFKKNKLNNCCTSESEQKSSCCCESKKIEKKNCCHSGHEKVENCCGTQNHKNCCSTSNETDCGCGKSKIKNINVSIFILAISVISLVTGLVLSSVKDSSNYKEYLELISNIVCFVPIILCGVPIIYNSLKVFFTKFKITAGLLVSFALIASVFIEEYFAAGEIAFIMQLGGFLEDITVNRAKSGIKRLLSLTPELALLKIDNKIISVKTSELKVGDIIVVKPGSSVAADGVILNGSSSLNQSTITGESLPVDKKEGDEVFEGTINIDNSLEIQVTRVGENSSIKKMAKLVQDAQSNKAKIVQIADKLASFFVPLAIVIAVVVGLITGELSRAVTIMVVFCPCSLVLATPTAIMASIGRASKNGIIIKSGEAIEKIAKIDTIAFDKTGTITSGNLSLTDIKTSIDTNEFLKIVASAENYSEHPISHAIVKYATEKKVALTNVENYKNIIGRGLSCIILGEQVLIGNSALLEENKIDINFNAELKQLQSQGKKTLLVVVGNKNIGIMGIADKIKDNSASAIKSIKENYNLETIMLTGDNELVGSEIAKSANIDKVYSDCLPEDKVKIVKEYINKGKSIAMVGDGINDAPALASATVGVAMGSIGSDITVDACEIVLMREDLTLISALLKHVKKTMMTIKANIIFSMSINFIAIGLASFGLINPLIGALIHNAGSVIVVLNAALLYGKK